METTKIPATKTVAEITALLGGTGFVHAVQTTYGGAGEPDAVAFLVEVEGEMISFRLPARVEPVFVYLQRKRSIKFRVRKTDQDREQAARVAWRQILRWVQAQLALIEVGMVTVQEVFLGYAMLGAEETFTQRFERMIAAGDYRRLLTDGKGRKGRQGGKP